jgi:transcriptional regulator with XRE-family HTH domain
MILTNPAELGLYVRDRRRRVPLSQADLSRRAGVSRRWLSDLEAGKTTAEVGLVFKVLWALDLVVDVSPFTLAPGEVDLEEVLQVRGRGGGRAGAA